MKAVFISDAHLKHSADERYVRFMQFLEDLREGKVRSLVDAQELGREKTSIDHLYIVGDFFDFWFCRSDHIHPEFRLVISRLLDLQKTGVHIHMCEGNHDFFMKEYFQDILGMEVFEEWATVEMDRLRMLVAHGDTADHSDRVYMMFRKILRSRPFYHIQRFIPASLLWTLAAGTSNVSKQVNDDNSEYLVEKMLSLATVKLRENYDAVIMGHCHKPVLRYFEVEGRKKTFVTLGDWIKHYSFLYYESRKFFLSYYQPSG
jgi:UDP-2,3-diacylglucosamine hydrolase